MCYIINSRLIPAIFLCVQFLISFQSKINCVMTWYSTGIPGTELCQGEPKTGAFMFRDIPGTWEQSPPCSFYSFKSPLL